MKAREVRELSKRWPMTTTWILVVSSITLLLQIAEWIERLNH